MHRLINEMPFYWWSTQAKSINHWPISSIRNWLPRPLDADEPISISFAAHLMCVYFVLVLEFDEPLTRQICIQTDWKIGERWWKASMISELRTGSGSVNINQNLMSGNLNAFASWNAFKCADEKWLWTHFSFTSFEMRWK